MALEWQTGHFEAFLDAQPGAWAQKKSRRPPISNYLPTGQHRELEKEEGGDLIFSDRQGSEHDEVETDDLGNRRLEDLLGDEAEGEEKDDDVDDMNVELPELPDLEAYFFGLDADDSTPSLQPRMPYPVNSVRLEEQAKFAEPTVSSTSSASSRKPRGALVDVKRRDALKRGEISPRPRLHLTLRQHVSC